MKLRRFDLLVAVVATSIVVGPVHGQSESHLAATEEFLEVMNMPAMISEMVGFMLEAQLSGNPILVEFRDLMEEFFAEVFTWDSLRPDFIQIYAEAFDENEIRQLTDFYRTPVGQKALSTLPSLMQQGAVVGQALVERNQPRLMQMLEARFAEMQRDTTKRRSD